MENSEFTSDMAEDMDAIMREAYMEQFQLQASEARYLMSVMDHPDVGELSPATIVEEIKAIGIDQLDGVDPFMFLETARSRQAQAAPPPETREQRQKRKRQEALANVSEDDHISGWQPLQSGEEFQRRNEALLRQKMAKPKQKYVVSTKFMRDRTAGMSRQELIKEFKRNLQLSIKYRVWEEVLTDNIDTITESLQQLFPMTRALLDALVAETERIGADSKEANALKADVRGVLQSQEDELVFFKQFRMLAASIDRRKEVVIRNDKYGDLAQQYAHALNLDDDEYDRQARKMEPRVRSLVLSEIKQRKQSGL